MTTAIFTQGSTLRHVVIMTGASTVGLVAMFTVDLVDMYFLSLLGEQELAAAVGYGGTLLFFLTAVSIGLQIGMGALVSRAEGAHRRDLAGRYCSNILIFSGAAAAVISAAGQLEGIRGIVTIGTPSDPAHVAHLLGDHAEQVQSEGEAEIQIGGRPFTIKRQFLEDIRSQNVLSVLKRYRGSILILHSPRDRTVDVNHAAEIFMAARHPKSFVSLAEADHLLSRPTDSAFAAEMIAAWANHLFFD